MKAIVIITSLLLIGFLMNSCSKQEKELPKPIQEKLPVAKAKMSKADMIKKGEYLVKTIGCDDCHSPKIMKPDGFDLIPSLRLSGHPANQPLSVIKDKSVIGDYILFSSDLTAAVGPWGTSYAANLTPDDTGLGNFTFEQFEKVLREGKYKGLDGGRPIVPPMPWFAYKYLSDEDMRAIFAFLQSLPPVKNLVPAYMPPNAG